MLLWYMSFFRIFHSLFIWTFHPQIPWHRHWQPFCQQEDQGLEGPGDHLTWLSKAMNICPILSPSLFIIQFWVRRLHLPCPFVYPWSFDTVHPVAFHIRLNKHLTLPFQSLWKIHPKAPNLLLGTGGTDLATGYPLPVFSPPFTRDARWTILHIVSRGLAKRTGILTWQLVPIGPTSTYSQLNPAIPWDCR